MLVNLLANMVEFVVIIKHSS